MNDEMREYCKRRLKLGAYYYGFAATGVPAIDLILGAVSAAGKMYHYTQDWNDGDPSPVDLIQEAADEAAKAWRDALPEGE